MVHEATSTLLVMLSWYFGISHNIQLYNVFIVVSLVLVRLRTQRRSFSILLKWHQLLKTRTRLVTLDRLYLISRIKCYLYKLHKLYMVIYNNNYNYIIHITCQIFNKFVYTNKTHTWTNHIWSILEHLMFFLDSSMFESYDGVKNCFWSGAYTISLFQVES